MMLGLTQMRRLFVGSLDSALAHQQQIHFLGEFQISLLWMASIAMEVKQLFKSVNTRPVMTVILMRVQESSAPNRYLILIYVVIS